MAQFKKSLLSTFATGALISGPSGASTYDLGAAAKLLLNIPVHAVAPTTIARSSPSKAIVGNSRFEVAPAGTYEGMAKVIAEYRKAAASNDQPIIREAEPAWLDASAQEVRDLGVEEASLENFPPTQELIEIAIDALRICAVQNITEPVIAGDESGGIEIYFKEGNHALLIAIRSDLTINIFDDDADEQWRGKYKGLGRVWKKHLVERMKSMGEAA